MGLIIANQRDKAFVCSSDSLFQNILPAEVPSLKSDHEETDSRVWLHALDGPITSVLIFSPDTDTSHIGLPLLGKDSPQSVVIQLSNVTDKKEYLHLNEVIDCMYRDVNVTPLTF